MPKNFLLKSFVYSWPRNVPVFPPEVIFDRIVCFLLPSHIRNIQYDHAGDSYSFPFQVLCKLFCPFRSSLLVSCKSNQHMISQFFSQHQRQYGCVGNGIVISSFEKSILRFFREASADILFTIDMGRNDDYWLPVFCKRSDRIKMIQSLRINPPVSAVPEQRGNDIQPRRICKFLSIVPIENGNPFQNFIFIQSFYSFQPFMPTCPALL